MKTMRMRQYLLGASVIALSACSSVFGVPTRDNPNVAAVHAVAEEEGVTGMMAIADKLAAEGNHSAAIPIYRHLSVGLGDRTEARLKLSISLIAMGNHRDAATFLTKIVDRDDYPGEAWYYLGKSWLGLGRYDEALAAFSEAANRGVEPNKSRAGRGIALAALGRADDALEAFDSLTDTASLSNKGLVLASIGSADEAIEIFESIISEGRANPRDRQNLALAYLFASREDEAYRMARIDLDMVTVEETFTFYRTLMSLPTDQRMQALVTGSVEPEWTIEEAANLELTDSETQQAAAERLIVEPEPEPEPEEPYELTEIPPLVEPEGWALQIGAYRTIENLMRGWTILYRANEDILNGIPPRRSEVDFGDREQGPSGFYYRLNAGPLKTLAEARAVCRELKARGTECWIRPPEPTEGKLPDNN